METMNPQRILVFAFKSRQSFYRLVSWGCCRIPTAAPTCLAGSLDFAVLLQVTSLNPP